jgi:uncharacterized membrane protein YvbJ
MFCSECGKEIADSSKFCSECGKAANLIDYDSIDKAKKSTWKKSKESLEESERQRVETMDDHEENVLVGWSYNIMKILLFLFVIITLIAIAFSR